MTNFSPSYDNKIERKYSTKTLEHKVQNKVALQIELGWPSEKKIPVMCIPAGLSDELGGQLFARTLPGIMTMNMELLILGRGDSKYGEMCTKLAEEKKHRVTIIEDTDESKRKMYAAADMALFTSDPTNLPELQHCLSYGVVPIAPECKGLDNYNAVQESGNAFLYDALTEWHCFAGLVRATETHEFPFDWRTIQRHCMESVK